MDAITIERLIRISKENPLLPETFVPWNNKREEHEKYLPDSLMSVHGLPLYDQLTKEQILEIERHEVVQVMYSYGWSEAMFCLFLNKYILDKSPHDPEFRFILRELIEEFRHQDMFAQAVQLLDGKPILPTRQHFFWGKFTAKYLPASWAFMSALSVELIADVYGKEMRRDEKLYSVLRKISELHHIEEGRHIHFAKHILERYTKNAGFLKRSLYSMILALNVHYMRTLYVKVEIFERAGVPNPKAVYKEAYRNYKNKFAKACLDDAIEFAQSFNGMNWLTRPFWRRLLKANV